MAIQLSRMDALERSGAFAPGTLAGLQTCLETDPEEDLYRINPLSYAERHQLPEREAIELFVRAAHAGLFSFTWTVVCPSCGFNISTAHALRELTEHTRCVPCEIDLEVALDDMVEISFTVAPTVRALRFHQPERLTVWEDLERVVASGNRILHPELRSVIMGGLKQVGILPRRSLEHSEVDLEPGSYRFISMTQHLATALEVAGEPTTEVRELKVEFTTAGIRLSTDRLQSGPVRLLLANAADDFQVWSLAAKPPFTHAEMKCELATRFRPFLTGKRLLTSQAFRDLYRTETLPPGISLTLRSLTFLFTDLKGSTEMYDRIGDFSAYRLVREHFDILAEAVADHDGAIVKTIGDAIMATFPEPGQALEATLQMHRRLDEWNQTHEADDLTLKVGIHEGPCIAVDSNDRLDYFGQTVNMAARIQGLASSRETYLSQTIQAAPTVAAVVARHGLRLDPMVAHLKGISEDVQVYRATLA